MTNMLIYKNTAGKQEAVSKHMVVRFSSIKDYIFNEEKEITVIHLTNKEKLQSLDKIETLVKKMKNLKC